ncbi:MAG: type II toxin-antitoxin system TacA family antitoxin [Acidimicrobiales bacterium]
MEAGMQRRLDVSVELDRGAEGAVEVGARRERTWLAFVRQTTYNDFMATKSERLNLRLTPAQDAVLRTAAAARRESTSDYVLRHAVEAAEMDLADRRVFVVDDAAWTELQALISARPDLPLPMAKLLSNRSR